MNDEVTKIRLNSQHAESNPASNPLQDPQNEKVLEKKSKVNTALAAGAVGLGIGAVAMTAMGFNWPSEVSPPPPNVNPNVVPSPEPVIHDNAPVATTVDDSMTFAQAFKAARTEVGPGGIFVWKDQVYNTYYAEEYAAMSPEDKTEFAASFNDHGLIHPDPQPANVITEPSQVVINIHNNPEPDNIEVLPDPFIPETVIAVIDGEDGSIVSLVDSDGNHIEDKMYVDVDGDFVDDIVYIDSNEDGNVETITILNDYEANGGDINPPTDVVPVENISGVTVTDDEWVIVEPDDPSNHGITITDDPQPYIEPDDPSNHGITIADDHEPFINIDPMDGPDYTNDANISDLV